QHARRLGASACFDMEHYDLKAITLRTFRELAVEPEFHDWPDLGIALQAYLRETVNDLDALIEWAGQRA
ncbi:MAG: hypothetical protein GWO24_32645, partial [Akkermansiaceae bacterium]|nr:hypothetical protein [Akkermansiaceae bacterium]